MDLSKDTVQLILVLMFLSQGQDTVGQTGGSGTRSKLVSRDESSHQTREPRRAFLAKVLEEKSKEASVASQADKYLDSKETTGDEATSLSSSSSSEESAKKIVLGIITSTTPSATLGGTFISLKKRVRQVKQVQNRASQKGNNWYTYKQNGRNFEDGEDDDWDKAGTGTGTVNNNRPGTPTVNNNRPGTPGTVGNKGTLGATGGVGSNKKPFNVILQIATNNAVGPELYNFFQYKPPGKLGLLWMQHPKIDRIDPNIVGRIDLLGNDNDADADEDDLDPANLYDWENRRYDRACLYVDYIGKKANMAGSIVTEEVKRMVDGQNEELARRFLDWQFIKKEDHETIALHGEGDKHPLYLTYKFLSLTMEIFRDRVCRNATPFATTPEVIPFGPLGSYQKANLNEKSIEAKLLPKSFVDELFRLFLAMRDITLSKNTVDYVTKKDEVYIAVLEKCLKEQENIPWFTHTCGDQVLSYDEPNNYACTPLLDYDFNDMYYDPVLDGMWHMFAGVQAFCFQEFNRLSTRLWHKYSMIIANSYTMGMRARWKSAILPYDEYYTRLLGPDFKIHLETMNRCMFGATLRSKIPAVIPRFDMLAPSTF